MELIFLEDVHSHGLGHDDWTMMWLYDNDDYDDSNYDNENDMNDDDDVDPYKKFLVELNKPSFTTSSRIKMCSIIIISYACLKLEPCPTCYACFKL